MFKAVIRPRSALIPLIDFALLVNVTPQDVVFNLFPRLAVDDCVEFLDAEHHVPGLYPAWAQVYVASARQILDQTGPLTEHEEHLLAGRHGWPMSDGLKVYMSTIFKHRLQGAPAQVRLAFAALFFLGMREYQLAVSLAYKAFIHQDAPMLASAGHVGAIVTPVMVDAIRNAELRKAEAFCQALAKLRASRAAA